jgi:CBS domain-containing protein
MYEFLEYRVRDVMTTRPVTIGPGASLAEAERLLEERDFNALPVVDAQGQVVGILTKLDVLKAFALRPEAIVPPYERVMGSSVREHMTREVVSVEPDTPLTRVLERMGETRYTSLPVIDAGRLVGVIAREDILVALRRAIAGERPPRPRG